MAIYVFIFFPLSIDIALIWHLPVEKACKEAADPAMQVKFRLVLQLT